MIGELNMLKNRKLENRLYKNVAKQCEFLKTFAKNNF